MSGSLLSWREPSVVVKRCDVEIGRAPSACATVVRVMPRLFASLLLALALVTGCGDPPTPAGTQILSVNVEEDLKPDQRKALLGVLTMPSVAVEFPDGKGSVEVEVVAARMTKEVDGKSVADLKAEPGYLRTINVKVKDAAGYVTTAALVGNPENLGTVEAPVHARLVQITRKKSGLTGSSMSQMTLKVSPRGVERQ